MKGEFQSEHCFDSIEEADNLGNSKIVGRSRKIPRMHNMVA